MGAQPCAGVVLLRGGGWVTRCKITAQHATADLALRVKDPQFLP